MSHVTQLNIAQDVAEIKRNVRLQWMLVAIAVILAISISKSLNDNLDTQQIVLQQQINMLARLQHTAQSPIDDSMLQQIDALYTEKIGNIETVISASTAEAKALTVVEAKIGKLLTRKRINLLGTETINIANQIFWSVRIEVAGELAEKDYIIFLANFDHKIKNKRITSLQYSPKISNSVSAVIDLLYRREGDE